MGKRMLALTLVLVIALSLIPTTVFATQGSEEQKSVVYDFSAATAINGTALGSAAVTATNNLYTAGDLNWKYIGDSGNLRSATMGGGSYKWSGIRFALAPGNGWVAVKLKAPGTGTYHVQINYNTCKTYGVSQVYLLPGTTEKADIDAALTTATALGSFDCNGENWSYPPASAMLENTFDCTAGEEYVAVFYLPNSTTGTLYACVSGMEFIHSDDYVGPVEYDQMVYDLKMEDSDLTVNGGSFATLDLGSTVRTTLKNYYNDKALNWYFPGVIGSQISLSAYFGGETAAKTNLWDGLRLYGKLKSNSQYSDYYAAAIGIRAPGNGEYKLTVDYGAHRFGAKKVNFYLLDAAAADLETALKSATALGSVNMDSGAASSNVMPTPGKATFAKTVTLEHNRDYMLVAEMTESGRESNYIYVNAFTLTRAELNTPADIVPDRVPEPEPIPENSVVYDFDLTNSKTGIYKGKTYVLDKKDDIHQRYEKGSLNWEYVAHSVQEDAIAMTKPGGMIAYGYEGDWVAFRIKSPGKGLYTLSLNHGVSGNGAVGAVYIVPGDAEDPYAALDSGNRVGMVNYYNDTGKTAITDGKQSVLGTWEFGDAEEYIVIFEAYSHTPYVVNRGYMFFSQLFMTSGDHTADVVTEKKINSIVVEPGSVKICDVGLYGATANINGTNYIYMPLEGKNMLVYNLDDSVLVGEVKTPFSVPRGIHVDQEGIIWMVGDYPWLFRYDPVTGVGKQYDSYKYIDPESYTSFDLITDGQGNLYFGSHPGGKVMQFNMATGEYKVLCTPHEDAVYPCGMEYKDGYLYTGIYGDKNGDGVFVCEAVKINVSTGEVEARLDLSHLIPYGFVMFRGAGLCGDVFFLGGEGSLAHTIAIDINTFQLVDVGMDSGILFHTTPELDGKIYFIANSGRGLHCYDSATGKATVVPGLESVTSGLRCNDSSFVTLDDPVYPGVSIITYSTTIPRAYNIQTGKLKTWEVVDVDQYGTAVDARGIIANGKGQFYTGAYNTNKCTIYDVEQGKVVGVFETEGQTDVMFMHDGVLYAGNYSQGAVVRVNVENPDRNVTLLSLKSKWKQSRIHTLTAGDGKIFFGSIPDRYEYGGCIGWIDLETMENHVVRDVVEGQAIVSVAYHDGYLFGTSSIRGGTGAADRTDLSAMLFVYDVANKRKVCEVDLREHIDGLPAMLPFIAGIAADPNIDKNGKMWGLVSETLFSFTFDKETGKVTVKEELSFDKSTCVTSSGRNSIPRPFVFDGEGYLYLAFDQNGGLRKINLENPADNKRVLSVAPMYYNIDSQNNLYYLEGHSMRLYPMDVTDADWAISEPVDAKISAIGKNITLQSEAAITAARSAYEKLSWRHKALVQNLRDLEEAEVDLLECKIDTIGEPSQDKQTLVFGLKAQYDALSERLQSYVKNYSVLQAAVNTIQSAIDKKAAAAVEKQIETIKGMGTITLDHEEAIRQIRAAYDALTVNQKMLVKNKQILLDAEAKIRVLRDERIEYLKQLIAGFGDITLEDEPAITEAVAIYEWMYMDERERVDYVTLIAAEKALIKLQKEAAAKVDALILAIGDAIDRSSKDAITAARDAYNALTPGAKKYVTQLAVLEEAEAIYAGIFPLWAIILIAVGGVVVLAGGVVAVLLVMKKKKAARPAQETSDEMEAVSEATEE